MRRRAALLIPLLLLSAGATRADAASEYFHPRLRSGAAQIRTIVVLPVRAEATKVGVKGAEPVLEQSEELAAAVASAVKKAFEQRGIALGPCPFEATETVAPEPDDMGRLADFVARFDQMYPLLTKKPKDVREGRFSLGDEVADLIPGTKSDVFVVVRAAAARQTGGLKWLRGDVFDMARHRSTTIDLTLVDVRTGDVLGLLRITTGPSVDEAVAKSVAKLPRG